MTNSKPLVSHSDGRCLEAVIVALDLACDGEKCTPVHLWKNAAPGPRGRLAGKKKPPAARTRTRVPPFGPRRVMWKLPTLELRLSRKELWGNVQCLLFTGYHKDEVHDSFSWPTGLKWLDLATDLGPHFNQPVQNVVWPESLQEICFGVRFCCNLDAVRWPASMRRVYLTCHHQKLVWPGVQVIDRKM
ncbi:unnamed protein product [Ectocarpus sp. CCAP 1310/34]|nr:unnamed protein product [Ectocarpus sp. CCAP 1310/34]